MPPRGGVVPPMGGAATSKTPTPAPTTRSSQVVRDEQLHHAGDPWRCRGKSPAPHSQDVEGQHARRGAGENGAQPQGRDRAPSNVVRSRSASRSTQLSPPPTPAEALASAQLLLDFPPAAEKLNEWRATIRSLVDVANQDEPRPGGPRANARSSRHMPAVEGPEVLQPRCTLLLHASYHGCRSVGTTLVIKFP